MHPLFPLCNTVQGATALTQLIEFRGMDPDLLQKSLNVLVKRGKAQVFGTDDQRGVKFF